MKKKIVSIMLITIMMITNLLIIVQAAGEWWERSGGSDLKDFATIITDDLYADGKFNAKTNMVPFSNIKIYNYGTNTIKQGTGNSEPVDCTESNGKKYYWFVRKNEPEIDTNVDMLYYAFQIPQNTVELNNVAKIVYEDGITYNGKKYNVVLNVKSITKNNSDKVSVYFKVGDRAAKGSDFINTASYDRGLRPQIGVSSNNTKVQVNVEYKVVDKQGNEVEISGLFGMTDIDCKQGILINDFVMSTGNTYMKNETKEQNNIKYKKLNNKDSFIYSVTEEDLSTDNTTAYIKLEDVNKMDLTFTFEELIEPYTTLRFDRYFNRYYNIWTTVTPQDRATITPSINTIIDGDNKTIHFSPSDPTRQYLKSVKVNGNDIDVKRQGQDITEYPFSDIHDDNTIDVVYGDIYNIIYETNGGTNHPDNPAKYTSDDNVIFKNPTRTDYEFKGWYESPDFDEDTKITEIKINSTGDKYLYAKWEKKQVEPTIAEYKVIHYLQNDNGEYDEFDSDILSADIDSEVTAVAKNLEGYTYNATKSNNKGIVKADGSLVLRLYYDKKVFTVTFEPKNDTKIDDQKVKYHEKATEPTKPVKDGYIFQYWYYIDENNNKVKYDFDTKVARDYDLIAEWEEVKDNTPTPTPKQEDPTTAKKDLANSGKEAILLPIAGVVLVVAIIFGKKYISIKKDMK